MLENTYFSVTTQKYLILRFSSGSRLEERQKQFSARTKSVEKSEISSFEFDPSELYRMIEERGSDHCVYKPKLFEHLQEVSSVDGDQDQN